MLHLMIVFYSAATSPLRVYLGKETLNLVMVQIITILSFYPKFYSYPIYFKNYFCLYEDICNQIHIK